MLTPPTRLTTVHVSNQQRVDMTATDEQSTGKRLLAWMELAGHTVGGAAETFGVSRVTIHNWTTGKKKPGREASVAIERATNGAVRCGDW